MELKHLNKDEFEQAVNADDELVVVDFFATWCGPCKMLGPVIERAADKFSDVHFYKVDIDEEMDLAARFQVMSVPTLIYFKRGEVLSKSIGLVSPSDIDKEIQQVKTNKPPHIFAFLFGRPVPQLDPACVLSLFL